MDSPRANFFGIHAVLFALFNEDETLNLNAIATEAESVMAEGCHGITVLGLATEVMKLNEEERRAIIEVVAEAVKGRVPFSVTIVGNSVSEQVALARYAQERGADWLILQPPAASNFSAQIYLDFYTRVANSVDLPIAIQNAPQLLGRALNIEDIQTLKRNCPNLQAVKFEDTAINLHRAIETFRGEIEILGGRGGMELTDCLRAGCRGFVLAPDIAPFALRVFNYWINGNETEAEREFEKIAPAIGFTMQSLETLLAYGKRVYGLQHQIEIFDRQPSIAISEFGLQQTKHWAVHLEGIRNEQ